jgi:hypothetical protein
MLKFKFNYFLHVEFSNHILATAQTNAVLGKECFFSDC